MSLKWTKRRSVRGAGGAESCRSCRQCNRKPRGDAVRCGRILVGFGHGAGSFEIEDEKLFETADGTVAVFGDGWRFVNMREEEALETGVSLLGIIAKAGETLWSAADVLDGRDGGVLHADARRENKIAGEEVHGTTNGLIEFQFFASGGMFGVDSRVEVVEKRDLGAQSVEIEQFRLSGV